MENNNTKSYLLELMLARRMARKHMSALNWHRLEEHLNEVVTVKVGHSFESKGEETHFLQHADWAMTLSEDEALSTHDECLALKVYALAYRALYSHYHGSSIETRLKRDALATLVHILER